MGAEHKWQLGKKGATHGFALKKKKKKKKKEREIRPQHNIIHIILACFYALQVY